jgi:AraC family transcriptional regulator of adaptative response / DNA-3-methyladenine glycosylase II
MCLLLTSDQTVAEVGFAAGFDSEAVFHRQFLAHTRLTPGAYRALRRQPSFVLPLPDDYRHQDVLAYLGRDAGGPAERRLGDTLIKAVLLEGLPMRLTLAFGVGQATVTVDGATAITPGQMACAHRIALRCLGMANGREAPGKGLLALAARRPGLVFPLTATVFEALVWAIVGQQVNLRFAAQLRRTVITLAGRDAGDGMQAHPDPAAVARLEPATLAQHKFSQSKARYLVETARALSPGDWDIESLPQQSAVQALRRLQALRGIGPWTAQYTLLRGGVFADCVPVGDAGLTAALQRLHQLPARPDAKATLAWMARYVPQRSPATAYLWDSLKNPA